MGLIQHSATFAVFLLAGFIVLFFHDADPVYE